MEPEKQKSLKTIPKKFWHDSEQSMNSKACRNIN